MRAYRIVNREEEIRTGRGSNRVAACVTLGCAFAAGMVGAALLAYWFSHWGQA